MSSSRQPGCGSACRGKSQIEFFLPYNFQEQQLVNVSVAPANQVSNRWGNAIGDFTVGVAKTFVHESGWIPSLLGRVNWEIPTGPTFSNETPLTSGQNKLAFSLTALKQQEAGGQRAEERPARGH